MYVLHEHRNILATMSIISFQLETDRKTLIDQSKNLFDLTLYVDLPLWTPILIHLISTGLNFNVFVYLLGVQSNLYLYLLLHLLLFNCFFLGFTGKQALLKVTLDQISCHLFLTKIAKELFS